MERYRDIRLDMPEAEAMPFWAVGSGGSEEADLAAWLRDVGGDGIGDDPFDPSIDASWLGAAPVLDADGQPAPAPGPAETGTLEAGA